MLLWPAWPRRLPPARAAPRAEDRYLSSKNLLIPNLDESCAWAGSAVLYADQISFGPARRVHIRGWHDHSHCGGDDLHAHGRLADDLAIGLHWERAVGADDDAPLGAQVADIRVALLPADQQMPADP